LETTTVVADARTGCRYEKLNNGLHVFTFSLPSRVAMDVWAAHMRRIVSETPPGFTVRYLMDIRQTDILPVRSTYHFGREWFAAGTDSPRMRTAVLHNADAHMTATQDFIRLLRENALWTFRFFDADHVTDAYHWLLADG
jgi:hypothetical protein